jgi:hypothetical protein
MYRVCFLIVLGFFLSRVLTNTKKRKKILILINIDCVFGLKKKGRRKFILIGKSLMVAEKLHIKQQIVFIFVT